MTNEASNTQESNTSKKSRERAFVRSYDYANGKGMVKDASTGQAVAEFDLSVLPQSVRDKLALSAFMQLVAGAMVEAHRDDEDAAVAGSELIADLTEDKVDFRDGVGVAMGGALKRVARALCELDFTKVKSPTGEVLSWPKGDVAGAYTAMRTLWEIPEVTKQDGVIATGPHAGKPRTVVVSESGKTRFNKIKATPEVAAKLATYNKKVTDTGLS